MRSYYYIYDRDNSEYINIIFHTLGEARAYLAKLVSCDNMAKLDEYLAEYAPYLRIEKHNKLYF